MSAMTDDRGEATSPAAIRILEESRSREKAQTLFYRRLAARADAEDRPDLAERFNDLHADEQHHLSRLTARILELGGEPLELPPGEALPDVAMEEWEAVARGREETEVAWYESLAGGDLDPRTSELVEEILVSERHHRDQLGGKWMSA